MLSTWLLVLVLGLYALAIFLARGARRETLRNVGCALVLSGSRCSSCGGWPATTRWTR